MYLSIYLSIYHYAANIDFRRRDVDVRRAASEAKQITFVVDLSVAVNVRFAYHLINLSICQTLAEIVHHLRTQRHRRITHLSITCITSPQYGMHRTASDVN